MTLVALRMGPLPVPDSMLVARSGLRWLREDGHSCRSGEVVAYCNVAMALTAAAAGRALPFADDGRDLQVAFAPRIGGRLIRAGGLSRGGAVDQLPSTEAWQADALLGHIDAAPGALGAGAYLADQPRLMMATGRRMTELAEIRSGLLTGWYDRSRAWWGDGDAAGMGTLVGLGTCEQAGILRGGSHAFLELFAAVPGPAQAVLVQDEPLVPCARVLLEGMLRTQGEFDAIAEDLARTFPAGPVPPGPSDWMFAGALLAGLQRKPLTEGYDVLTRQGLGRTGPADAVVLSLSAELPTIYRHKRLGYAVCSYPFRLAQAGPVVQSWLRVQFEPVRRGPAEVGEDYRHLLACCARSRAEGGHTRPLHLLVLNQVFGSMREEVYSYAPFDRPLGRTLGGVRVRGLNLLLHDLAREHRELAIVDADRIAADLGISDHLPDGVHQSGALQDALRREILRILRDRGVPGFA